MRFVYIWYWTGLVGGYSHLTAESERRQYLVYTDMRTLTYLSPITAFSCSGGGSLPETKFYQAIPPDPVLGICLSHIA